MALPTKDQICKSLEIGGNILDPKLSGFKTIDGVIGPECYSGGFCLVYPVSDGTTKYAFRVWHTEIEGIKDRLKKISSYLQSQSLSFFVDFEYVDNALRVCDDEGDEQSIDAVRMKWVDGKNLVSYIDSIVSNVSLSETDKKQKLYDLAFKFKDMVAQLHRCQIAHGDLQHGNIIIESDGSIKLVDYDSVYVPTFKNEEQVTSGMAAYQHPSRKGHTSLATKADDYYSEQIIYLSLLCFAEDLSLWVPLEERDEYSLLFTESDLMSLMQCKLYQRIASLNNPDINRLLEELERNLSYSDTHSIKPLEEVLVNKYATPPTSINLDSSDIADLVGNLKKRATYKPTKIEVQDFNETEALSRYSNN